jgi:chromate transporter
MSTSPLEVFTTFLRLGLTSFGGPVAHLGYFRTEFVERRGWLTETQFTQLLAISQFLPGPASSQLGFGIGLLRAGWRGALAAFVAFTLPSALLLLAFANASASGWMATTGGAAIVHGLKLVAVAVVAHGVWKMARQLTPDAPRLSIAIGAVAVMVLTESPWMQLAVIAGGGIAGLLVLTKAGREEPITLSTRYGRGASITALVAFGVLLAVSLAWASPEPTLVSTGAAFWSAGSLVFGGGHVVLPLLEQSVVSTGWVSPDTFLAGYGAAQAIPGPMFSLSTYLGAAIPTGAPAAVGALVATLAVFAPGFLLLIAVIPAWSRVTALPGALRAVSGINAAVVGLLGAALYDPVWTSGIEGVGDIVVAAGGLAILGLTKRSPLWVVAWCIGGALLLG